MSIFFQKHTCPTLIASFIFLIISNICIAQIDLDREALKVREIYKSTLESGQCYDWLRTLTTEIGPRLSGSGNAAAAIEYTRQIMDTLGLDTIWLQPCVVNHWVRGEKEMVRIVDSRIGSQDLNALALGNAVGTGPDGVTGEVLEVHTMDELRSLGKDSVAGKIVFFNRPMDPTKLNTFTAYGGAVDQRGIGHVEAAKLGAIAAVVRSMTTRLDDHPHTGATRLDPDGNNVPSVAISTNDAELLSRLLDDGPVSLYIRTTCQMLDPVLSYNVIGEIRGSEMPEEIILVGGHLDSWDVGHGAHDDGTGCAHSLEVMHQIRRMQYQPRRTLRCVLFMNEENGLQGARTYAEISNDRGEFHLAAIESDAGGFTPRGFRCGGNKLVFDQYFQMLGQFWDVLEPYGLYLRTGGGGADINPLKSQKGILIGLRPDSQRYFDYHHAETDRFETVNERELQLGAAAMTSLVYLIDKYLERAY